MIKSLPQWREAFSFLNNTNSQLDPIESYDLNPSTQTIESLLLKNNDKFIQQLPVKEEAVLALEGKRESPLQIAVNSCR